MKPLPAKLVDVWKHAGARVGWMTTGDGDISHFRGEGERQEGDVPAFQFRRWRKGTASKLPRPEGAFGLELWDKTVTNADLKELAALKTLRSLSLFGTKVTDAGLKELSELESLRSLALYGTKVTDAGLTGAGQPQHHGFAELPCGVSWLERQVVLVHLHDFAVCRCQRHRVSSGCHGKGQERSDHQGAAETHGAASWKKRSETTARVSDLVGRFKKQTP